MKNIPLAERIRPVLIDEVVGQKHILAEGKILNRIIKSKHVGNMIFYGPPGVGKTTVANIISNATNKKLYKLNATNASIKDIQAIVDSLDTFMTMNGVLLYLDEIQNFNKKQQQSLLEFMENGKITVIASTTENPYHYIYKAILSRSMVFEFKYLDEEDIVSGLKRGIEILQEEFSPIEIVSEEDALRYTASASSGDLRKALNILETSVYAAPVENGKINVHRELVEESSQVKGFLYDKDGDSHYDILSAFQKSIRGSDADASLHYLARLIKAGDLISICRRLLVISSEDIGMAYPSAITIVKSCVDAAMQVGLPEARINLAQAVLTLATAPKSNSVVMGIGSAMEDLETRNIGDIPPHLKDAHYSGAKKLGRGNEYKYPHNYKNNYVKQQYLPKELEGSNYYIPGNNKMENAVAAFLEKLKE